MVIEILSANIVAKATSLGMQRGAGTVPFPRKFAAKGHSSDTRASLYTECNRAGEMAERLKAAVC
jgi:hypothetical protein